MPSEIFDEIVEKMDRITALLEYIAEDIIVGKLDNVVTTDKRKKMWALFDGLNNTSEVAKSVNVDVRSVQLFVKDLENLKLIKVNRRGYPIRRFDIIPGEWL